MECKKDNNLNLRKDCCDGCICDGDFCPFRDELTNDIGSKVVKNKLVYSKSCKYFQWD